MKILKYDENKHNLIWDNFVKMNPNSTFYHLISWKKVIEKTYGLKPEYYLIYDRNKIIGIIPFFKARNIIHKEILISLPYASYGGILTIKDIDDEFFINYLNWVNKKILIRRFTQYGNSDGEVITMVLDLPDKSETLWGNFKPKVRNQVRKAEKNNIEFFTGKDYFEDFFKIYCTSMKRLGTPIHKKSYFQKILVEYKDNSFLWVVKKRNVVVGAMLLISYKDTITDLAASTLLEYNKDCANMLLYWGALKKSIELGYKKFDFGRSTRDTGTFKFKNQWGAKAYNIENYYLENGIRKTAEVPQPGILSKIWSKLPLFAVNFIGPKLRKHIF